VNSRLCLLLLLVAAIAPLRAQDQPVHMRPEFALTFPVVGDGEYVTVKYPVMINESTQVTPGMQLRVLYVLSTGADTSSDLALAHAGTLEQSYARDPAASAGGTDDAAKIPPELAHEIEGYRRTIWTVPNNFVLAMAQYPTEQMHLIYAPKEESRDLHDEVFHFFDGLFVGAPGGQVTVLGVEREDVGERAGLKAGDVILAVGGYPTHDLKAFSKAYADAKRDARESEAESYTMTVRGADGTTRTAKLAMPLSIKGGLMDGFTGKP
jgi:hypothetical protein